MLQNGLGDILREEASSATRIVDLFCGGASVSWFAASKLKKPVIACDLQAYAAILAGSVVKRTRPAQARELDDLWLSRAARTRSRLKGWHRAKYLDAATGCMKTWRQSAQELCFSDATAKSSLISRCYGGHYFSPTQALSFDSMLSALPDDDELQELCLAGDNYSSEPLCCCPRSHGSTVQSDPNGWQISPRSLAA